LTGSFDVFVCGPLPDGDSLARALPGGRRVAAAHVTGTLYDTGDGYPALVLAGTGRVSGQIWRFPAARLWQLDLLQGVEERLLRRVGVRVNERACWAYVAGPKLARRLTSDRVLPGGAWPTVPAS
jgi:gamma-glutamylcyclotransferase (GGCT)/AIG2-like uncharacterized protein YtfP